MRIAFLNSIETETYGGMEEWIRLVASGLIDRGHRVYLIGRPGSRFLSRVGGSLPAAAVVPLPISGDFNPVTINRLYRHLRREKIDVISVNFNKDLRLGGVAARLASKPRVVWSVGMDITKNSFVHRLVTPRLVDGVIVPSRSLKGQITRHGYIRPDLVEVIPIGSRLKGLPPADERPRHELGKKYHLPPRAVIAVTSGRLVNHKGHAFLIEAAPAIVARHPDIVFMFVGDGYLRTKHEQRIARLGLDGHFVFTGMLDDLWLELTGADLMIHPSIIEPFGIALIEGMAAGLPVIATNVGGIPEVVGNGDCAVLVEPGQVDALSAAVIEMLDSPERMRRMGLAAQKRWRENFTIDIMLNRVENYMASIAG
ncbi:MAG: glycosyltransferase family 4 protein [Candidatus Zixiibacteriota bacterium]|nr:MAG: glycosyltransferase family 4 protein [candidate division Zixibacteria bacterium]